MVFPLLPAIIGSALRIGITSASVKGFGSTFVSSLPFGIGYGGGTVIGFNAVPQFGNKSRPSQRLNRTGFVVNNRQNMPYRRYSRYSRYSRYPTRRRYSRYTRPYRRSYY